MPAWVDGAPGAADVPGTASGPQSHQSDYAAMALTPSSALAIRDHARKLLESPRGLSKEALTWAKNLANKRTTT